MIIYEQISIEHVCYSGEIVINLARSSETVDRPYMMLSLSKLCLDVALMQYGPALQLALHRALLADKLASTSAGQYLELFSSPGDLLNVLYRKVQQFILNFG
jgi:hypothetical protein